ncbi:ATPase, T2SS/T4P/T4SS family [Ignavibacteriales bacterium]
MMLSLDQILNTAKPLLNSLTSQIPRSVISAERIPFLVNLVSGLDHNGKGILLDLMNSILLMMIKKEASDIEFGGLATQKQIWLRIHGKKERTPDLPSFTEDETAVVIINLLSDKQKQVLLQNKNIDFSHAFIAGDPVRTYRFRADAYYDMDSLALNMRAISPVVRKIETMGFSKVALQSMHHLYIKQGLVLITGITGSGKSSTLDAIVDMHNETDNAQVIVIAQPIEFVHISKKCIIRHREVGKDVASFKDGVIQSLRQDPDIIIIGEMRDPETIMASLEVADTGHKVFSTLHTSSAVESIDRIIAEVHPNEQPRVRHRLADVLTVIISQKLLPSLDGKRVMAKEVLVMTPNIQAAIKNNNSGEIYMMINQGSAQGMITMEQDIKNLYMAKKISLDTAISYANQKGRMKQILGVV